MVSKKCKVIFLLASISQPRCIKRIQSFINNGYDIEVYGFDRGYYNVNAYIDGVRINNLGIVKSGKGHFNKFINSRKILIDIFNKPHDNNEVIYYAFSFDIALICKLGGKKYIYEISDLVYGYFKFKTLRSLFALTDKWLIKNSFLTVLTSEGFWKYLKLDKFNNAIVQPNRVNSSLLHSGKREDSKWSIDKLRFAYVGAFRNPNTIFRFARIIGERYPNHEFSFFGDSGLTHLALKFSEEFKNVHYRGPFKNPDDLENIYKEIDLIVACYDSKSLNERVAEPNKLYEALHFNKPIIVSDNTYLAEKVAFYNCGFVIDASIDENVNIFLDSLTSVQINKIKESIQSIPMSEIIDDDANKIISYIIKNYENNV